MRRIMGGFGAICVSNENHSNLAPVRYIFPQNYLLGLLGGQEPHFCPADFDLPLSLQPLTEAA
jgi:hypothetical protein